MSPRLALALIAALTCCTPKSSVFPSSECPACAREKDSGVHPLASDGLLGARWGELNVAADTHLTLINGEPHVHSGFDFENAFALTRDNRVRFLLDADLTAGAWGDQNHGVVFLEHGGGFRVSLTKDPTIVDVYLQVTGGFMMGFGPSTAKTPEMGSITGGGIGLRVFRFISFEATSHWDYAAGTAFVTNAGTFTQHALDLGLGIRVDLCAFGAACNRKAIRQKVEDRTCALYTDAKAVCVATPDRASMCKHAVEAMAIRDDGPLLARDAVAHFLAQLSGSEPKAKPLVETDACLSQWRACGREQERYFGRQDEQVDNRRMYSPYVLELLQALGCNADGTATATCNYTCEDQASKPAICGGK